MNTQIKEYTYDELADTCKYFGITLDEIRIQLSIDSETAFEAVDDPRILRDLYFAAPINSNIRTRLFSNYVNSCARNLERVITSGQAEELYMLVPEGSEIEKELIDKWIGLCSSVEEITVAYEATESGSHLEQSALQKWKSISLEEIGRSISGEDFQEAIDGAPPIQEFVNEIIKRWDDLAIALVENAITDAEIVSAYHEARIGSPARKLAILKKLQSSIRQ